MDILIDIETVPAGAEVGMDLYTAPGWEPSPPRVERGRVPANWRDPQKIADREAEIEADYRAALAVDADRQREEAWEEWTRGSLRWQDVRIGCVGIRYADGDSEVIDAMALGEDGERRMLLDLLEAIPAHGRILTWGDYDARILRSRMLAHRIRWGALGISGKPWDRRVVDLQALLAEAVNGSPRDIRGVSVDAACDFLGLDRPGNPIKGSEVLECYITGRWDLVVRHCLADVEDEWRVWEALAECMGEVKP